MHAGGRPLEYTPQKALDVKAYLESCKDKEEQRIVSDGDKSTRYEFKLRVKIPTIEGCALYLGIHIDTIYDWEKKFEEFSEVIGELRRTQADRLINSGLSGDYNPVITKVLLSKHGYKEIKENEVYGKDGAPLGLTQDQAIAAIKSIE